MHTHYHVTEKVDDIVTGVNSTEEALEFYKKSENLFKLGGFNLRKFLSNSDEVQSLIDETVWG